MAAHARRQVVEAEKVVEGLRVAGPALHLVEQGQLAVQQRLAAPGQAAEYVVESLPQPGLFHSRPDSGLPDQVERLPDPADLVAAHLQRRRLGVHVYVLTAPEPGHDVRQLNLGELQSRVLQAAQAADDAPRDQDGHHDGEQ